MSLLEVRSLEVELRAGDEMRRIISSVSLDLEQGEAIGLVGESGSGKSVTARAVMGLLPASARVGGSVLLDGREMLSMPKAELRAVRSREVAMIFQDPRAHINPVQRIGSFLCEALVTVRGVSRREARSRVADQLRETGVPDAERRLDQYPHELSGGLLQRVMIAAALVIEPRLLIADEPTTALDVTTQAEVMAILDELRRERGLALLFITHDLDLAAAVCDRTAVMYAGSIVEVSASAALHDDPLHPYTAGLAASRPSAAAVGGRLAAIPGRPIAAFDAAEGCAFAPRCRFVQPQCESAVPPLRELGEGAVACHRSESVRGRLSLTVSGGGSGA